MLSVREIAAREPALSLVAGARGLGAPVTRTHMVESLEIAGSFVGDGELIFTTGAGLPAGGLMELVRLLQSQGASGVVVNTGPYIPVVAPEVAAFAEEGDFPLFLCPWEVRMAEIMHRVSFRIEERARDAGRLAQAFKSAAEGDTRALKRLGFGEGARFYTAALKDGAQAEGVAHCFELGGTRFAVFADAEKEDVRRGVAGGFAAVCGPCRLHGIAAAADESKRLAALFKGERGVRFLDESGVCQLLLGIRDRALLEGYCDTELGKLLRYDAKKKAGLMEVLDTYIRCGSSLKEAAELLGVHKNTVTNRVKKCGDILGRDMADPAARMDIEVAMLARRILAIPE